MSKHKANFKSTNVSNSKHLDSLVKINVEGKSTSYYLITNSWDDVCNHFNDRLPSDGTTDLNVVDIFNIPNALDVIKSAIKSHRETISTACLSRYTQLTMLVVIHKSFPRVVSYNGSVGAEIGV